MLVCVCVCVDVCVICTHMLLCVCVLHIKLPNILLTPICCLICCCLPWHVPLFDLNLTNTKPRERGREGGQERGWLAKKQLSFSPSQEKGMKKTHKAIVRCQYHSCVHLCKFPTSMSTVAVLTGREVERGPSSQQRHHLFKSLEQKAGERGLS